MRTDILPLANRDETLTARWTRTCRSAGMQFTVCDDRQDFNQQTHAYAEYRAFAGLAGHREPIAGVTVTLERGDEAMRCAVALTLRSGEMLGAEATGAHIYAAIDRAVAMLSP